MSAPANPVPGSSSTPVGEVSTGRFGTLGLDSLFGGVMMVVLGAAALSWALTRTVYATCDGHRMSPQDSCQVLKGNTVMGSKSYEMVMVEKLEQNQWLTTSAAALLGSGILFLVVLILRWRRDRALLAQVRAMPGTPLLSSGHRSKSYVLAVFLGAIVGGMAPVGFVMAERQDQVIYYGVSVLMGLMGLWCMLGCLPRSGSLIQLFDDRVRLVAKGRIGEGTWNQVSMSVVRRNNKADYEVTVGNTKADLEHFPDSAILRTVLQRLIVVR